VSDFGQHAWNQEGQTFMDGPAPGMYSGINPYEYQQNEIGQQQFYTNAQAAEYTYQAHAHMAAEAAALNTQRALANHTSQARRGEVTRPVEIILQPSLFEQALGEIKNSAAHEGRLEHEPLDEVLRTGIRVKDYFLGSDAIFVDDFLKFTKEHGDQDATHLTVFPVEEVQHQPTEEGERGKLVTSLRRETVDGEDQLVGTVIDTSAVRKEKIQDKEAPGSLKGYEIMAGDAPTEDKEGTWSVYLCTDMHIRIGYKPNPQADAAVVIAHPVMSERISLHAASGLAEEESIGNVLVNVVRKAEERKWQRDFEKHYDDEAAAYADKLEKEDQARVALVAAEERRLAEQKQLLEERKERERLQVIEQEYKQLVGESKKIRGTLYGDRNIEDPSLREVLEKHIAAGKERPAFKRAQEITGLDNPLETTNGIIACNSYYMGSGDLGIASRALDVMRKVEKAVDEGEVKAWNVGVDVQERKALITYNGSTGKPRALARRLRSSVYSGLSEAEAEHQDNMKNKKPVYARIHAALTILNGMTPSEAEEFLDLDQAMQELKGPNYILINRDKDDNDLRLEESRLDYIRKAAGLTERRSISEYPARVGYMAGSAAMGRASVARAFIDKPGG
jgi:hypothetical protein